MAINGTRWLATAGTLLVLKNNRYGLLFSGGSCIDADSDAFHYIGYAESDDLMNWTVINGFDNPNRNSTLQIERVRRLLASRKGGVERSAIETWIHAYCGRESEPSGEGVVGAALASGHDGQPATAP